MWYQSPRGACFLSPLTLHEINSSRKVSVSITHEIVLYMCALCLWRTSMTSVQWRGWMESLLSSCNRGNTVKKSSISVLAEFEGEEIESKVLHLRATERIGELQLCPVQDTSQAFNAPPRRIEGRFLCHGALISELIRNIAHPIFHQASVFGVRLGKVQRDLLWGVDVLCRSVEGRRSAQTVRSHSLAYHGIDLFFRSTTNSRWWDGCPAFASSWVISWSSRLVWIARVL